MWWIKAAQPVQVNIFRGWLALGGMGWNGVLGRVGGARGVGQGQYSCWCPVGTWHCGGHVCFLGVPANKPRAASFRTPLPRCRSHRSVSGPQNTRATIHSAVFFQNVINSCKIKYMRSNALSYFYPGKARGSWSKIWVRQELHLTNIYSVPWHAICVSVTMLLKWCKLNNHLQFNTVNLNILYIWLQNMEGKMHLLWEIGNLEGNTLEKSYLLFRLCKNVLFIININDLTIFKPFHTVLSMMHKIHKGTWGVA